MVATRPQITARDWKLALQRAFDGDRNAALEHLGGLDELIRVDIANSADAATTTVELYEALDDFMTTWRWRPTADLRVTAMMLDVVRAFQPRRGGPRVLELVRLWKSGTSVLEIVPGKTLDVKLLALRVLEKYYATPIDNSREWDWYLTILYGILAESDYSTYILSRVRKIDAKDCLARVKAIIAGSDDLLPRIVGSVVSEVNSGVLTAADNLSFLYTVCLPDRVAEFEIAVKSAGGTATKTEEQPVIETQITTIVVETSESQMLQEMEAASSHFERKLDMMMSFSATAGDGNGSHGAPPHV